MRFVYGGQSVLSGILNCGVQIRHGTCVHMCLELPNDPSPDCEAPLLKPICKFRWPSDALSWSSVNSLLLASAILGPSLGPVYSGCFCVYE